ncbi:MAG: tRNA pseudouridine(55) synthase TruB [Oscillospiraceae bacterium]|nr:tRNA pseudouridine(55) synthase TruB [Oscillospiraceae bacterium]
MTDGILLINKPRGYTSFDVIARLRGMTRIKRIGHAGTLDPMATGVLPCLIGTAARLCDVMPDETKTYRAGVKFGITTDMQDITGTVLSESDVPVTREALDNALLPFRGTFAQLPPMYSAVRVNGQRLYDLAREGREVEREARDVTIFDLEVLDFDEKERTAEFTVTCSKGTYVRTLFHDVGQALGCGAALTSLCRTQASGFSLSDCITMEDAQRLTDEGTLLDKLLPVSEAFKTLQKLEVGQWQAKMLTNGVALSLPKLGFPEPGRYAVWHEDTFLGLGLVDEGSKGMKMKRF